MNRRLSSVLLAALVSFASLTGCTGSSKPQETQEMSKEQEQKLGAAMEVFKKEFEAQRAAAAEHYTHKLILETGCKLVDGKANAEIKAEIREIDGNCEVVYGGQYFATVLLSESEFDPRSGFDSNFEVFSLGYSARQSAELYFYDPTHADRKIVLPRTAGSLQIFSGDYVSLLGDEGMDANA